MTDHPSGKSPARTFADLHLSESLLTVLKDIGYETPSPIQSKAITPILEGRDLIGQAQTGTGKTAAFALPLLEKINLKISSPQVMVLTPTRELTIQVAEAFHSYARKMSGFHVLPIYGGQSMEIQLRHLKRPVHVVVGTPGRIMDHMRRSTLPLDKIASLVLDEADEMLRMGFIDDVEWILEQIPKDCQKILFSATMPDPIRRVARKHLVQPEEIHIKSETVTVPAIRQYYWIAGAPAKLDILTRFLESEERDAILIFVRTKTATVELAQKLDARGYRCAALSGDISQNNRERIVSQFKNGKLDIVIATDVAARGIDVARVTHVINYDIPGDVESYIHRIGRTGRAGRTGSAILFVSPRETGMLRTIERLTHSTMERLQLPNGKEVTNLRIMKFSEKLVSVATEQNIKRFSELAQQIQNEHSLSSDAMMAALLYLAQKDQPLHADFKNDVLMMEKEIVQNREGNRRNRKRSSVRREERNESKKTRKEKEPKKEDALKVKSYKSKESSTKPANAKKRHSNKKKQTKSFSSRKKR